MNRQTWNWCETDIAGYFFKKVRNNYKAINGIIPDKNFPGCKGFYECIMLNNMTKMDCLECYSFHYPANRKGCWDVWELPYNPNPQGVKSIKPESFQPKEDNWVDTDYDRCG